MHPTQKKNNNTLQAWCFFKKHKHQTKQKLSCFSKSFFSKKHQTKKTQLEKTQALQQRLQRNISPKASKTGQSGQSPLGPLPTSRAASPDPEVPRKHPQKTGDLGKMVFLCFVCFFLGFDVDFFLGCKIGDFFGKITWNDR